MRLEMQQIWPDIAEPPVLADDAAHVRLMAILDGSHKVVGSTG